MNTKAIFNEMTAGREVKLTEQNGLKYIENVTWGSGQSKSSNTFRNFSITGPIGDPVIEFKISEVRNGIVELKFFP